MTSLTTIVSTVSASFLASFVEVVEAFTIVLAVGVSRSWRPAFAGVALGLAVLGALVLVLGPLLEPDTAPPPAIRHRGAADSLRHALAPEGDPARRRLHRHP